MPRDGRATRERLLEHAERLFATKGIHQTTTREIVVAAGQRNASALTYHFGSRGGILLEILRRHGDPLDEWRGRLLAGPPQQCSTRELVAALLVPYASCTGSAGGRNYLRIVAQLTGQFASWRLGEVRAPHLQAILDALEARVPADAAVRRQRVVSAIMLMTAAAAERARQVDAAAAPELDPPRFASDLADVIVAVLQAPVGPALHQDLHPGPGLPAQR